MLVNYDDNPQKSILYTSSVIFEYLKFKNNNNFHELYEYCIDRGMEYSLFLLSLDWLYILGIIKNINERDEVII